MKRKGKPTRGPGGVCICPECDKEIAHSQGKPCTEEQCPDCGAAMLRKGSERHRTGAGPAKKYPEEARAQIDK